ncbi:Fic family protein [Flavobacterium sp.]|uniref:Fic family protein n=1 Tax=Flavobacterium sp. TaxID=239 RepID=UPI003750C647
MATPGEKLAASLEVLQRLQDKKIIAIKATDLSRVHKERLLKQGFIREVFKGWYLSVPPDEKKGDSTSWYTSYWDFCSRYLQDRYDEDYWISADQSLLIHAGNDAVPHQMMIRSTKGNNSLTSLLFGTSLFTMKSELSELETVEIHKGLRILNLTSAIVYCSPSLFTSNPIEVRTAFSLIHDASPLLALLLDGGHALKAGRIVGAFRNIGQVKVADTILKTMKTAGYDVREVDPFEEKTGISLSSREHSPYVNRIRLMWQEMRKTVIAVFPKAAGLPIDKITYLKQIEEIYTTDAYHSLSIEKYRVSPELIERVRSGEWNIQENEADKKQRDAMAARGYWQAFNSVKESVIRIVAGENAGKVADDTHGDWYRELFAPSVVVGLLKPSDLAGYRNHQVYIGQSKHVPINKEAISDVMPVLFQLLEEEEEASVRAVLGHFIFVYIHPYMDGNGRIGRFLMNVMLSSGGYPWTVIPVEDRATYMNTLEQASVGHNIAPFAKFIGYLVEASINGNPIARI